jgi:hypothetical protein
VREGLNSGTKDPVLAAKGAAWGPPRFLSEVKESINLDPDNPVPNRCHLECQNSDNRWYRPMRPVILDVHKNTWDSEGWTLLTTCLRHYPKGVLRSFTSVTRVQIPSGTLSVF